MQRIKEAATWAPTGGNVQPWRLVVVRDPALRTGLGALQPGDPINLERPVRLQDRLGGHLVQGEGRVLRKVGTDLLAAPAHRVHAGGCLPLLHGHRH